MREQSARPSIRSMVVSMLIGLGAGLMVAVVVGYVMYRRAGFQGATGRTVPAVVAAVDLPAGSSLAFEKLASRAIPEALATPSVVRNEAMSEVLGSRTRIDLRAGDLIYRSALEGGAAAPAFPPDAPRPEVSPPGR